MHIQRLYRVLLLVQPCLLTYLFLYGPRGWRDIEPLQKKIASMHTTINEKKRVVAQLEQEELSWHYDSFNKEKVAREQLQMARATDVVFYR